MGDKQNHGTNIRQIKVEKSYRELLAITHDHAFTERHRGELEAFAQASAVTPAQLREQVENLGSMGATRAMVLPIWPDWERGLRSFAPLLTG